jgi:hypothetical protein
VRCRAARGSGAPGRSPREIPEEHYRWCTDHRDAVEARLSRKGTEVDEIVVGRFGPSHIGELTLGVVQIRQTVAQTAEVAAEFAPPLSVEAKERFAEVRVPVVVHVEPQA